MADLAAWLLLTGFCLFATWANLTGSFHRGG